MKPINISGHSAYQERVLTQLRKYYPNAASLSSSTWQIIDKFWNLNRKGQILRSTPNTAPLICGACNTQPEGLSTMA